MSWTLLLSPGAAAASDNVVRLRDGGDRLAVDTLRVFPDVAGAELSLRAPMPQEIEWVDEIVAPDAGLGLELASRLIVVAEAEALSEVGFDRLILAYDVYTDDSGAYRGMEVSIIDEGLEFAQDSALLAKMRAGERCFHVEPIPCDDGLTCFSAGYYCAGAQDLDRALDTAGNSCVLAGGPAKTACKISKEMIVAIPLSACGTLQRACVAGGTLDRLQCAELLDDPMIVLGGEECDLFGTGQDFAAAHGDLAVEEVEEKPGLLIRLGSLLHALGEALAYVGRGSVAGTPAQPVSDTVFDDVVPNITDPYCGASPFC